MSETMSETWRAVYRDQQGRTYSCPVVKKDGAWAMVTSDGHQPITHEFQDDVAGMLTFVEYREEERGTKLHIEPKQPGQSSLAQLQSAHAKVEAQARADRQRAHQDAVAAAQLDPRKVAATMRINAEYAALKRPRGGGQFLVKNSSE